MNAPVWMVVNLIVIDVLIVISLLSGGISWRRL